jgi:hypothetical protein
LQLSLPVPHQKPPKDRRHPDRSCSQHFREQRSGGTPAFAFPLAVAFLLSSRGDLLLFLPVVNIFRVFSPKIACQAPELPKLNKQNKIELHVSSTQTAILKTVEKKQASPEGI